MKRTQTYLHLGYHPETEDTILISDTDRYAGTYVVGVQGVGKSGLLENLIVQDIASGQAVIFIDPHGDVIDHCIATMPDEAIARTFLLDMTDEPYPFGVNIFNSLEIGGVKSIIAEAQSVDRIMHIFEVLWKDVLSQQHLPRYLRAAILTLLSSPGATLLSMYRFLLDDAFRLGVLKNVTDSTITDFWRTQYDELPMATRIQRTSPLLTRLESLFLGRSLVRNIIGQPGSKLDFRTAIENKEIIFVKLPVKLLEQDAKLIGTFIIAQIHAALFSFADLPEDERPGFSLYVDEFAHFATKDFDEMFTEGRKFGNRVTVAHQYRQQMPDFLQTSTMTARIKVCFRMVPEDARKMAQVFPEQEMLKPEDIETDPIKYLLRYGSDDETVQRFIDIDLRSLHRWTRKKNRIEIITPGIQIEHIGLRAIGIKPSTDHPTVTDPAPFLNHLLYDCMKYGNSELDIPLVVAYGFSNAGHGFYPTLRYTLDKQTLLSSSVTFPPYLVVDNGSGKYWTRLPEGSKEQLYHFLFHLRQAMRHLADEPIGRKTSSNSLDIAQMLTQLPRRAAFIQSGDTVSVIYTEDTAPPVTPEVLAERFKTIQEQTRIKYCTPKDKLEEELKPTIEADEMLKTTRWEVIE